MTEGDDRGSTDDADSLLRAVAAAPARLPETIPARVAHFRIVGRLGRGGMGVVYRAEDEKLRRTVALKVLPDTSGDEERKQRFLREARSAASITHPNVAVVHQVDEADGRVYIAMELVEGETLRARLDRGRLDPATVKELGGQIARGLAAAHDKGIVHRDLKPENVMITPAGVVKLLDFGLAKPGVDRSGSGRTEAALAKTETLVTSEEGRVMGTPEYMSPEQATGEPLDVRSDVFSFGVVLYEMLSGTRPFVGTPGALVVAIARDPVPPLRERATEVDAQTEAVVQRCMAKSPADRYANAAEIVTALSRTEARRGRRGSTVVAALALLVAAAAGAVFFARRPEQPIASTPLAPPAAASSSATAAITRIIDLPPPKTSVPAAGTEYALGLQAIRDNTWFIAVVHLMKAVALDPTMAEAHLRLSRGPARWRSRRPSRS